MEGEVTQQKHQEAGLVPVHRLVEGTRMEVTTGQGATVTTEAAAKEEKKNISSKF